MIKQIWTIRNIPKLLNGFTAVFSVLILVYCAMNVFVMENTINFKLLYFADDITNNSKYLLLILPVITLAISLFLIFFSSVPKKLRYEINEVTRITALNDYKNHREFIIGCNLLLTVGLSFISLDSISFAKSISGFSLIPTYVAFALIIPFAVYKLLKMKKIYEI